MAVETSVVVVFGETTPGAGDVVVVELDPNHENNLDSDDNLKSTFAPGEVPVFLLHHASTLQVTDVKTSSGSLNLIGSDILQTRESDIQFVKVNENSSLSYVVDILDTVEWMGNNGILETTKGTIKITGGEIPCIGSTTYTVTFNRQYMLTPPALELETDETYKILVVIYMDVISAL